jgi:hypothetical protein
MPRFVHLAGPPRLWRKAIVEPFARLPDSQLPIRVLQFRALHTENSVTHIRTFARE